ncbi:hypothetical protein VNO77_19820 [Canavalia gladiata]|uniref:Uncharacterized protein n=1 Tax=Canavalia gladiata TaxID=3824 RepID=A0AAN9QPZ2_CANGL
MRTYEHDSITTGVQNGELTDFRRDQSVVNIRKEHTVVNTCIVKRLQDRKHICGMTGDGVNDTPALKRADVIVVADATEAARGAFDIVLMEPELSVCECSADNKGHFPKNEELHHLCRFYNNPSGVEILLLALI